jgi:2-methylcitrate dehydratase PrpD
MTLAIQLAEFVAGTTSVPSSALQSAMRAVCDLATAAIVGFGSPGGCAARAAAKAAWGAGHASCWFTDTQLAPAGAAFANAAIASMLDLDDGHRAAAGHPGASIIPAVLAGGEFRDGNAERILAAMVLGYEISVRIGAARDLAALDTLATGRWCGPGAAAAVGWLRGLSVRELAQAMAIAHMAAPHMVPRVSGNNVKEGIPWATAAGITAVELAAAGFTGPLHFLDDAQGHDPSILIEGLGRRWLIESAYFKPYGCCRWAHAAIDALLNLHAEHSIAPTEIEAIEIHTFARALTLGNETAPATLEAAQYSVPFCSSLGMVRGAEALLPLRETSLADPEVLALARRVTLAVDPALDAMFSRMVPARVVVRTLQGAVGCTVTVPKGDAGNPMTEADQIAKFRTATRGLLDASRSAALENALHAVHGGDIAPLQRMLCTPLAVDGKGVSA